MTISDAYATAATYRAINGDTDATQDAEILDDLKAVSRWIDRRLGRFFTQDAAVVTRRYDPPVYGRVLIVDDIASSAGLEIKVDTDQDGSFADETAFASTDYQLWPLNADRGPETAPWTSLYLPAWSTKSPWTPGLWVQVTAIFGYPAVPKAIERATCHLTAILRIETPRATARVAESMDEAFATSPGAQSIIGALVDDYGHWGFS